MSNANDILERMQGVAADLRLGSLQPLIVACQKQLRTQDGIDVAVFGRFKAGKSPFLNHLSGRDVLPIGVAAVHLTRSVRAFRDRLAEHVKAALGVDLRVRFPSPAPILPVWGQGRLPRRPRIKLAASRDRVEAVPTAPHSRVIPPDFTHL